MVEITDYDFTPLNVTGTLKEALIEAELTAGDTIVLDSNEERVNTVRFMSGVNVTNGTAIDVAVDNATQTLTVDSGGNTSSDDVAIRITFE